MPNSAKTHNQWTPETIQRFWDYHSQRSDLYENYFSYQLGRGLVNFLQQTDRLKPGVAVLDYGCGVGFLAEQLMTKGVKCYGSDASPETVQAINQKFQNHPQWQGAVVAAVPPTLYTDEMFDIVTCIETLEHLSDETLTKVLLEIYRVLKPGGIALFTTPNDEDLAKHFIFCPFCQSEFHYVQHVRSFSDQSLTPLLEQHQFNVLFCRGIDLGQFQRSSPHWKDWSLGIILGSLRHQKNRLLDRLFPQSFPNGRAFRNRARLGPHLCAVVERPVSEH